MDIWIGIKVGIVLVLMIDDHIYYKQPRWWVSPWLLYKKITDEEHNFP